MSIPAISPLVITNTSGNGVSPIVIEMASHPFVGGEHVAIGGVLGNTNANTADSVVTFVDSGHFSIPGTGNGAYGGGGSVWPKGTEVVSATMTKFDSNLEVHVVDKTGDTLYGQYTATGTPALNANASGARIRANAAGAVIKTASGGRFSLGDGDDVELNARTRTILISPAEAFDEYNTTVNTSFGGRGAIADDRPGFVSTQAQALQPFWIPLTRIHDGAKLLRATLYFFPRVTDVSAAVLPAVFPSLNIFRLNPQLSKVLTSLSAAGEATLASTPASPSDYTTTKAVGSQGAIALVTSNGGSATVATGATLTDASGNTFAVVAGDTFADGDPVTVQAQAPSSGPFLGAGTNHAAGDTLTWTKAPSNVQPTALVAVGGLTGGLNSGYAQSIVFTPDDALATIDMSTYIYIARFRDDDACFVSSGWAPTVYTGLKLEFGNITSMRPQ